MDNSSIRSEHSPISIHQALHGYSDGHQLLASSVELPQLAKRQLLFLSDAQVNYNPDEIESNLTAYPLEVAGYYAFARTWPAPEMRRPGCVWTHTLLIKFSDIASLQTLREVNAIQSLFCRPVPSKKNFNVDYMSPLAVQKDEGRGISLGKFASSAREKLLDDLVFGLYGVSNPVLSSTLESMEPQPVFLQEQESQNLDLVWALWLQLWPRLRRQFSFAFKISSPRKIEGHYLDLHIVSTNSASAIRRDVKEGIFVGFSNVPTELRNKVGRNEYWTENLVEDLQEPNPRFRKYLRIFGAELGERRDQMASMAFIYTSISRVNSIVTHDELHIRDALLELIDSVAAIFPHPSQGVKLKSTIFGRTVDQEWVSIKDYLLLYSLVTSSLWRCLPVSDLNLIERGQFIWKDYPVEAKKLLSRAIETGPNPLLELVLLGIARVAKDSEVVEILSKNFVLSKLFISEKPDLALSPELWSSSIDIQRELLDTLSGLTLSAELKRGVGEALFISQSSEIVWDVTSKLGEDVVRGMLSAWEHFPLKNQLDIPLGWQRSLAAHPVPLLETIIYSARSERINPKIASLISLLDPSNKNVLQTSALDWLKIASSLQEYGDKSTTAQVLTFILSLGLDNMENRGAELIASSFHIVHAFQAKPGLSYTSLKWLDKRLPSLGAYNWDVCERLRRAVVEKFAVERWPARIFLGSINDQATLIAVIRSAMETPHGKDYVKAIRRQVNDGSLSVPNWQYEVLREKKGWRAFIESLFE